MTAGFGGPIAVAYIIVPSLMSKITSRAIEIGDGDRVPTPQRFAERRRPPAVV